MTATFLDVVLGLLACGRASPPVVVEPGLHFGVMTTHADSGRVQIQDVPWTLDGATGWAVVVRFPRDAAMTIHPSDAVVSLDRFTAPGPDEALSNGGFYDNGAMGLVVHGGVTHTAASESGGSGVASWSPTTPISIVHRTAWTGIGTEALQSVDRIVDRGVSLVHAKADARRTARTGVAVGTDMVALVVAASTTSAPSEGTARTLHAAEDEGLPLWAFADLMVHLGATEALNFDGGISVGLRASVAGQSWSIDGGAGTINGVLISAARPQ